MITDTSHLKLANAKTSLQLLRKEYHEALKEDRCFHVLLELRREIKLLEQQFQEFMQEESNA
jgi:hypothetical protein